MTDTLTSSKHYSNAVCRVQPEKLGRQFIGAFYDDGPKVNGKVR